MPKRIVDIKSPPSQDLDSNSQPPVFQPPARKKFFFSSEKEKLPEQKKRPIEEVKFAKQQLFNPLKRKNILFLSIIFLVILGAIGVLSFLGVEVKIWPVLTNKNFQEELLLKSDIFESDFSQKVIPGKSLEAEGEISSQFNSSEIIPKEIKAQGVIHVYNNYHLSQVLVASTRFLSPDEKLFRSTKRVNIPAETSLDVEVMADEPGPEYNIGPTTFSVPGLAGSPRYTVVFGKSFKPMEGGFAGKTVRVSKDDLKKAEDELKEKLTSQLKGELLKKAESSSMTVLEETISPTIIESSSLAKPGTELKQFDYTLKMKIKALAFKKDDLENFAKEIISQKIGAGERVVPDTLKISFQAGEVDLKETGAKLQVSVLAQIYSDIDTKELKSRLLGKKLKQGKDILASDSRLLTAQVKILSFWKRKFPQNPEKIEIKLMLSP